MLKELPTSTSARNRNKRPNLNRTPSRPSTSPGVRFPTSSVFTEFPRTYKHRFLIGCPPAEDPTAPYPVAANAMIRNLAKLLTHLKIVSYSKPNPDLEKATLVLDKKAHDKALAPVIYPWRSDGPLVGTYCTAYTAADIASQSFDNLRQNWFHKLSSPKNQIKCYTRVYIGWNSKLLSYYPDLTETDMARETARLLHQALPTFVISADVLQFEETIDVGYFWAIPFTRGMEFQPATRELSKALGLPVTIHNGNAGMESLADGSIVVDIKQKAGVRGFKTIPGLFVEAVAADAGMVVQKLRIMYPHRIETGRVYPGNFRTIFIPTQVAELASRKQMITICSKHKRIIGQFAPPETIHCIKNLDGPLIAGTDLTLARILFDMAGDLSSGRLFLFEQINLIAKKTIQVIIHKHNVEKYLTVIPFLYAIIKQFGSSILAPMNLTDEQTHDFYCNLRASFTTPYCEANEQVTYDATRGVFTAPADTAIQDVFDFLGGDYEVDSCYEDDMSAGSVFDLRSKASGHDMARHRRDVLIAETTEEDARSAVSHMTEQSQATTARTKARLEAMEAEKETMQAALLDSNAKVDHLMAQIQLLMQERNERLQQGAQSGRSSSWQEAIAATATATTPDLSSPPRPNRHNTNTLSPSSYLAAAASQSKGSGPGP
ncbi:hypothetical protein MPSEU_000679900 [Mayamaea pseudoterrestris]|nr:hypothetical protein MPSEU_000679900 [Mayamaea pseudoterrestris]